ncbi:MAG: outer membrane lipoprotein-sorting protein, partial [Proteobacteria bacterium]|nr:outer membrane lipoprotein-sorting protein [Pseudomonadota bacterium]
MQRNNTLAQTKIPRLIATFIFIPAIIFLYTADHSLAETPEEKGLAITVEADRRDTGYGNSTADMLMVLKNRHGQESRREIRFRNLEVEGDGDKSLTIFDSPGDVKGTAFLNYTHKEGDDDQWLYLPALKRVKRISSRNKSGSFMGSEFSYEDITSQEIEKYTYKWIREEIYEGNDCFVSERYPVDKKNSGYSRQVAWIDKQEYRTWKVEYYDRKNMHLKTLTMSNFEQYEGKFWRALELYMVNHQTGK